MQITFSLTGQNRVDFTDNVQRNYAIALIADTPDFASERPSLYMQLSNGLAFIYFMDALKCAHSIAFFSFNNSSQAVLSAPPIANAAFTPPASVPLDATSQAAYIVSQTPDTIALSRALMENASHAFAGTVGGRDRFDDI